MDSSLAALITSIITLITVIINSGLVKRTKREAIHAVNKAEDTAALAKDVAANIQEKIENGSYSPPDTSKLNG
jgi:hypothetical protein